MSMSENTSIEKKIVEYQENLNELVAIETKITQAIAEFQDELAERKKKDEEMREQLKTAMRENDVKKFENDFLAVTYVPETERTTIDTKRLKEEKPDLWNEYSQTSKVKDSVRIKVK